MDMHKGFSIDFSLSLIFLKGLSSELTFPYGFQLRLDFHNLDLLSRNEKGEIFLYTKIIIYILDSNGLQIAY